jgi:hypothetical protein
VCTPILTVPGQGVGGKIWGCRKKAMLTVKKDRLEKGRKQFADDQLEFVKVRIEREFTGN